MKPNRIHRNEGTGCRQDGPILCPLELDPSPLWRLVGAPPPGSGLYHGCGHPARELPDSWEPWVIPRGPNYTVLVGLVEMRGSTTESTREMKCCQRRIFRGRSGLPSCLRLSESSNRRRSLSFK